MPGKILNKQCNKNNQKINYLNIRYFETMMECQTAVT